MAKYLGIDIGGTWIKGTIVDEDFFQMDKAARMDQFRWRE